jgi:2-dehydro-3-deoxygalactonokinase
MDAKGQVLAKVSTDQGILTVRDNAFAETLEAAIGAWRTPATPVILSGMIGSRQGWLEVPYLAVPAALDDIGAALVRHPRDQAIHIVPGLAQDLENQAPDVMRGEETQILGVIADGGGDQVLVMPGTHSKWVRVEDGRIVWFATFMTGELFAVLKEHSILGRLMTDDAGHDEKSFEKGLLAATTLPGGLLQRLFSARTLGLFERLPADGVASYLSGLLIGSEIEEAQGNLRHGEPSIPITVIGSSPLAERYQDAMARAGLDARKAGDDAAARGQFLIASQAGLCSASLD